MTIARSVYVISDLHIGGAYPDPNAALAERRGGFRMMTRVSELAGFVRHLTRLPAVPAVELVINGDFLDFLAEEVVDARGFDAQRAPAWKAFRSGRGEALDVFRGMVARDRELFLALSAFVASGRRLTILLGNHDLELCIPDVRAALEREIGPGLLRLVDDGQALTVGDAIVEHGNLFDSANVVDHDALREFRAAYSRGWFEGLEDDFTAPTGSHIVAQIMNPIKVEHPFIDLLKPESEPLFSLLLALEPGYRGVLDELAKRLASGGAKLVPSLTAARARRGLRAGAGVATASGLGMVSGSSKSELSKIVERSIDEPEARKAILAAPTEASTLKMVSSGQGSARWSLFKMLLAGGAKEAVEARIPAVQATLRVLQSDVSFSRDKEVKPYMDAARWLAKGGGGRDRRHAAVVFGHTHHAKDITDDELGFRYLNTGTWANVMRFPDTLTSKTATRDEVRGALVTFVKSLQDGSFTREFTPTYVRLDVDEHDKLHSAELRDYDYNADTL